MIEVGDYVYKKRTPVSIGVVTNVVTEEMSRTYPASQWRVEPYTHTWTETNITVRFPKGEQVLNIYEIASCESRIKRYEDQAYKYKERLEIVKEQLAETDEDSSVRGRRGTSRASH